MFGVPGMDGWRIARSAAVRLLRPLPADLALGVGVGELLSSYADGRYNAAVLIQAAWRMSVAREDLRLALNFGSSCSLSSLGGDSLMNEVVGYDESVEMSILTARSEMGPSQPLERVGLQGHRRALRPRGEVILWSGLLKHCC